MAKLDSLIVDLQVNSAALRRGLDQANVSLSKFAKQAQTMGKLIAGSFAFSIGKDIVMGIGHIIGKSIDAADKMDELAQSTGVTVEQLSRMNYAAGFSGISTEELAKSMGKLNKNMVAAETAGSEQANVFKQLGINIHESDGALKSAEKVMGEVAGKFSKLEDGANKSAAAQQLFGKAGASLIPMLNAGAEGLAAMAAEADALGITMSQETASKAAALADAMDKVTATVSALGTNVMAELAPTLTTWIEEMVRGAKEGEGMRRVAQKIADVFRAMATLVLGAVVSFKVLLIAVSSVSKAFSLFIWGIANFDKASLDAAFNAAKEGAFGIAMAIQSAAGEMKYIWAPPAGPSAVDELKKGADGLGKSLEKVVKQLDSALKKFDDMRLSTWVLNAAMSGTKTTPQSNANALFPSQSLDPSGRRGDRSASLGGPDVRAKEMAAGLVEIAAMKDPLYKIKQGLASIGDALSVGGNIIASKMGELGTFIQSIVQGAQAGGVWGAIVAALAELIVRTKNFADFVSQAASFIMRLVTTLDPLLKTLTMALSTVLGAVENLLVPVLKAIGPVFKILADVVNFISPFIGLVAVAFQAVGILIHSLLNIVMRIVSVLKPVFQLLFPIVQGVLMVVVGIMGAIVFVWNSIVAAIAGIVDAVVSLFTLGVNKTGGDFVRALLFDTTGFGEAQAALANSTWDSVDASNQRTAADQQTAEAGNKTADAFKSISESLTNIPSGYKIALARFNATAAGGAAPGGGPGPGGGSTTNVYGPINVHGVTNLAALGKVLSDVARRAGVLAGGNGHSPNASGLDDVEDVHVVAFEAL